MITSASHTSSAEVSMPTCRQDVAAPPITPAAWISYSGVFCPRRLRQQLLSLRSWKKTKRHASSPNTEHNERCLSGFIHQNFLCQTRAQLLTYTAREQTKPTQRSKQAAGMLQFLMQQYGRSLEEARATPPRPPPTASFPFFFFRTYSIHLFHRRHA